MYKKSKALTAALLVLLMLYGCGSEPPATQPPTEPAPTPPAGAAELGGQVYTPENGVLDLNGTAVTGGDLLRDLWNFEDLHQVELKDVALSDEERASLVELFPEITFLWNVDIGGKQWLSTDTKLSYAGEPVDVQALIDTAKYFLGVEEIDLTGCGCTAAEIADLREAFGGAFVRSEITVCGQNYTTEATEMDLTGIPMGSTVEVEQAAAAMPYLEKVIMVDCGIPDEEMGALNERWENVQFVWEVHFSVYTLRTDAKAFCASDRPYNNYIAVKMYDHHLEPLKYCTELVALDLGHMNYTNLSFLEGLTKLQYLILADAKFQDISVLANMPDLFYLELFKNTINDLSPLLECKNLRHLNVGHTSGYDIEVLKQLTWLERLWYPGSYLSEEESAKIVAALPDTEVYIPVYDPAGSTGGGWRNHEVYQQMRDYFGMFYQPGGTGSKK